MPRRTRSSSYSVEDAVLKAEVPANTQANNVMALIFCTIGIYVSFITWSILQEKISTTGYGAENVIFKLPLVVNIIQSLFAFIVGSIYLSFKLGKPTSPLRIFLDKDNNWNMTNLKYFSIISITQSISSPIGYQSLAYVDYLIYLLAKSCKLIPVMMVQFFVFGQKFPAHKYAVATAITLGVSIFTIFSSNNSISGKSLEAGEKVVIGIGYLLLSMFLDGLTNSTQDQLFKLKQPPRGVEKITGAHLMSGLNFCNFSFTLIYTLIFTNQISYVVEFCSEYPEAFFNVILFGVFGSIGQIFIFIMLEKFNSIVLVTVTVTRKMFSMILSVIVFGHVLNWKQWIGVGLVFGGIGLEAWLKNTSQRSIQTKKTN